MLEHEDVIIGPSTIPEGFTAVSSDFYAILIDMFHSRAAESPTDYAVGQLLELFPREGSDSGDKG